MRSTPASAFCEESDRLDVVGDDVTRVLGEFVKICYACLLHKLFGTQIHSIRSATSGLTNKQLLPVCPRQTLTRSSR